MYSNHMDHLVQHNRRFLVIVLIPLGVFFVLSLVVQFFFFTEVLAFFILLSVLEYRNDKLFYNDAGIVICGIVKGAFFVPWENIVSIERTSYYPFPGRLGYEALRIDYSINGRRRFVSYDVYTYLGLPELLTFYYQISGNS